MDQLQQDTMFLFFANGLYAQNKGVFDSEFLATQNVGMKTIGVSKSEALASGVIAEHLGLDYQNV